MAREERLEKINEKIERLKELKRKLERRLKKEKKLAYEYAKELSYWMDFIRVNNKEKSEQVEILFELLTEKLKEVLCKKARNKSRCLYSKLELVAKHDNNKLAVYYANQILELLKKELEESKT